MERWELDEGWAGGWDELFAAADLPARHARRRLGTGATARAVRGQASVAQTQADRTAYDRAWVDPAALFDELAAESSSVGGVVGVPGRRPIVPVLPGDVVVRRSLAEGRLAAIARVEAFEDGIAFVDDAGVYAGGRRIASSPMRAWSLLEEGKVLHDVVVLREGNSVATVAESMCSKARPAPSEEPKVELPLTSIAWASPTRPYDDAKLVQGVPTVSKAQNLTYWNGFGLDRVKPLRGIDPVRHPNAYANRAIKLQRFIRKQGLGKMLLGRPLTADGVIGQDTLYVLWRLATDDELQGIRTHVRALGFDLSAMKTKGRAAAGAAASATFPPEFLFEWTLDAKSDDVLTLYQHRHRDTPGARAGIVAMLFHGVASRPPDFSWDWVVELARRIYGGRPVKGRAALFRTQRSVVHAWDVNRMIERHLGKKHGRQFLWWAPTRKRYREATKWVPLTVPSSTTGKAALDAWEKRTGPPYTRLAFAFYMPQVSTAERVTIVEQWLARRRIEEDERKRHNREQLEPKVDEIIAALRSKEKRNYAWAYKLSRRPTFLLGYPTEIIDQYFDILKSRDGGKWYEALFDAFGGMASYQYRSVLVRVVSKSKHANSTAYQRFLKAHRAKTEKIRKHAYDFDNNRILLDKKSDRVMKLGPKGGVVATEVSRAYHRDESVRRLKEASRKKLCVQTVKELADMLAKLSESADGGGTGDTAISDEMIKDAIERASKTLGLSKDDVETLDWELSMRVYGIRPVMRDGVRRAEIDSEMVERYDIGGWTKWTAVPGTRRWRSEEQFGEELFFLVLSEIEDLLSFLGTIVIGGSMVFLLWAGGAGAVLVELAGGGKLLIASIAISEIIYLITAGREATLEGVFLAAIEGYVQAVGFRLFAPVGRWVGAKLTGEGFRRALAAWLLSKAVVGAGGGALSGFATQLAVDMFRVLREGGEFSSWDRYLKSVGMGAAFGALFEIGGSVVFAGIFRTVKGTVLTKAGEVVDLLVKNKVSPTRWLAEVTGAKSRFGAWLGRVTQSARAGGLRAMDERIRSVTKAFLDRTGTNVKLMFYTDIIELAEVELSRGAVDGLEALLKSSAGKLEADDIVAIVQALRKAPKKADGLLQLMGAVDDSVLDGMMKRETMLKLVSAEGIGGLAQQVAAADMRFLLQQGFGGSIDRFDAWALTWSKLGRDTQAEVMDAISHFGHVLTPDGALTLVGRGVRLDAVNLLGVEQLVSATSVDAVEAFLAKGPTNLGRLLEEAGTSALDRGVLAALVKNPEIADRLLARYQNPAELVATLEAANGNAAFLDEVTPLLRPGSTPLPLDVTELEGFRRLLRVGARSSRRSRLATDLAELVKTPDDVRKLLRAAAESSDGKVAGLMRDRKLGRLTRDAPTPPATVRRGGDLTPAELKARLAAKRKVGDPKKVAASLERDKAFTVRKKEVGKLLGDSDRVARDLKKAKVSKERFDWMRKGNPARSGERLPLAFESWAQYDQFRKELAEMVAKLRVDGQPITAQLQVLGTASTFYSGNPSKPLGHHFDAKAPLEFADIDIDLYSPELVEHMLRTSSVLNDTVLVKGEKTIFKNQIDSGAGFHDEFPEVLRFSARWESRLGREVDIKLKADARRVKDVPKPTEGAIEMFRKESVK